jgi:hypothetical protein
MMDALPKPTTTFNIFLSSIIIPYNNLATHPSLQLT